MTNFLVSPELVLEGIARERPETKIDQMCKIIGEVATFILIEKMAGKTVNFPSVSTLQRINKSSFIQQQLGEVNDKTEFNEKVKRLSTMLGMSKPSIIRTYANKKYTE